MAFHRAMDWHEGETAVHNLTGVSRIVGDNPTSSFLSPRAAYMASRYPLMAIGTTATNPTTNAEEIWCTVWGGSAPMAQQVAQSVLGIRTIVDTKFDPVVEALFGDKLDGEVMREDAESGGRLVAGLSIDLESRGRVKLAGRVVAGACSRHKDDEPEASNVTDSSTTPVATGAGEAQVVLKITQSLGNCPKYLNRKTITPSIPSPQLLASGPLLSPEGLAVVSQADLFFVASAHKSEDMDCNHRGGPPGFLRASITEDSKSTTLTWPEYSGNNLYQTLGNLHSDPRCGICVPDFTTGSVLYLTGTAELLIGKPTASAVLSHSSLAVRFTVTSSRLVANGLPFRGTNIPASTDTLEGRSPYNPRVRYLVSENLDPNSKTSAATAAEVTASLTAKTKLTPTITRYRFSLSSPTALGGPWLPGQHVALDFSEELDMGYSHMRDDDPGSLNDDYIRNFTVSSAPGSLGVHGEEFEITVRDVGRVTGWLAHSMQRVGMVEVGVRGFGGGFAFDFGSGEQEEEKKSVGFVAAGIGITPLLGQMETLLANDARLLKRTKVLWSIGIRDIGLVADILRQYPALKDTGALYVYLTGDDSLLKDSEKDQKMLKEVLASSAGGPAGDNEQRGGLQVLRRRLTKEDLLATDNQVNEWYLCTSPAMREEVQRWLPERGFVWENFNY